MHKRQQQKTFDQQKTVEPVSYTSVLSLSVCVCWSERVKDCLAV